MKLIQKEKSIFNIVRWVICSMLAGFAVTMPLADVLNIEHFENNKLYIATVGFYIFGSYNWAGFIVSVFFFLWLVIGRKMLFSKYEIPVKASEKVGSRPKKHFSIPLACLLAFWIPVGTACAQYDSLLPLYGGVHNVIRTLLIYSGWVVILIELFDVLSALPWKSIFVGEDKGCLAKKTFLKSFLVLMICYAPMIIISYPGNLNYDTVGQIDQVLGYSPYTEHAPLASTLLVGGLVKLGGMMGSYNVGLFIYVIVQAVMLSLALAATISQMAKRGANKKLLYTMLAIYVITPAYSNIVSTAIKDVPFLAFVVAYMIFYCLVIENPEALKEKSFLIGYILIQIGMVLTRNNGIYVLAISGIVQFIVIAKRVSVKDKAKGAIRALLSSVVIGLVVGKLIMVLLAGITNATSGSKGEMLSIPLQLTARYVRDYPEDLTEEDIAVIENMLGDLDRLASKYNPNISDTVKMYLNRDADASDYVAYGKTWVRCFFRHPMVYIEGFLVHVHGWFSPQIDNAIRYEAEDDRIGQNVINPALGGIIIYFYKYLDRVTPIGVLENIGVATWTVFFLAVLLNRKNKKLSAILTPAYVSILIAMASPCFYLHPRYLFPVLFSLPLILGFCITSEKVAKEKNNLI